MPGAPPPAQPVSVRHQGDRAGGQPRSGGAGATLEPGPFLRSYYHRDGAINGERLAGAGQVGGDAEAAPAHDQPPGLFVEGGAHQLAVVAGEVGRLAERTSRRRSAPRSASMRAT